MNNVEYKQTKCPKCGTEMELTRIKDADSGDVLITVEGEYCPNCPYHELYISNVSK